MKVFGNWWYIQAGLPWAVILAASRDLPVMQRVTNWNDTNYSDSLSANLEPGSGQGSNELLFMKLCLKWLLPNKGAGCGHLYPFGLHHMLCEQTGKQWVPGPTWANTLKACRRHWVCATCQQHWAWFAKLYWLEINVVFRSHLGNPSVLACIYFISSLLCPWQRKPNAINSILNDSPLISSHRVSFFPASLCPSTYTHSCLIKEIN